MYAEDDTYDGVPYAELIFAEVDWSEAAEHIRDRSGRLGLSAEFDVEPEWATEALADPVRLVGSAQSRRAQGSPACGSMVGCDGNGRQ